MFRLSGKPATRKWKHSGSLVGGAVCYLSWHHCFFTVVVNTLTSGLSENMVSLNPWFIMIDLSYENAFIWRSPYFQTHSTWMSLDDSSTGLRRLMGDGHRYASCSRFKIHNNYSDIHPPIHPPVHRYIVKKWPQTC